MKKMAWLLIFVLSGFIYGCAPIYGNAISVFTVENVVSEVGGEISNSIVIGGDGNEWVSFMECSSNGSRVLVGSTVGSFGHSTDIYAARIDNRNALEWGRTYGGGAKESLKSVLRTSDNGFLLVAVSESLFFTPLPGSKPQRPFIIKLDPFGQLEWSVLIERDEDDLFGELVDVAEGNDGSFVLVGQSRRMNERRKFEWDLSALKLNSSGAAVWGYRYKMGDDSKATDIAHMSDGSFMISGQTVKDRVAGFTVWDDALMVKIDTDGKVLSGYRYSIGGNNLQLFSIRDNGNSAFFTGVASRVRKHDVLAMSTGLDGEFQWARIYRHVNDENGIILSDAGLDEEWIAMAGWYGGKRVQAIDGPYYRGVYGMVIMIDNSGRLVSSATIGADRDEEGRVIDNLGDGTLCLAVNTESYGGRDSDVVSFEWDVPQDFYAGNEGEFREEVIMPAIETTNPVKIKSGYKVVALSKSQVIIKELELEEISQQQ